MANEINASMRLSVVKGSARLERRASFRGTQTGKLFSCQGQNIGHAAHELVSIQADVVATGAGGVASFTNLSTTNYVEVGIEVATVFCPFMKILPGESWPTRLATVALYAKANTAAVQLETTIWEP